MAEPLPWKQDPRALPKLTFERQGTVSALGVGAVLLLVGFVTVGASFAVFGASDLHYRDYVSNCSLPSSTCTGYQVSHAGENLTNLTDYLSISEGVGFCVVGIGGGASLAALPRRMEKVLEQIEIEVPGPK